jgi:DNA-binding transcriptional LysR family regulator
VLSDQDLLTLIEAGFGVGIMPRSVVVDRKLLSIEADGLKLRRTVSLYAVAGRERSSAVAALMKLLRSLDWETTTLVAEPAALAAG